ncbi:uncharacterized protein EDB91DRAFT_1087569 [Suillus paluster]|uniref:uncharacterized protein n=1 Tax=Suillus paluster TaxID=48578 RepID=UPI001B85E90C|nr:uncharacterized protein EDB91DRAFT_1087569 [Suillus paluster]KAG1724150.1 hypothetical protein EDB91DRAFT_1087569 [Suillus paluster]
MWKETDASFVYQDSDSEVEPASPTKSNHKQNLDTSLHHNVEDPPFQYDQEVHGDFGTTSIFKQKTKTQNDFLRDYLPWCPEYISLLLGLEQLTKEGICDTCGEEDGFIWLKAHVYLPFHNLQWWNGKCYQSTTLLDQGYVLYLGHGGEPCPYSSKLSDSSPWADLGGDLNDVFMDGEVEEETVETAHETKSIVTKLVIVHSTGVYSHHVAWCQCPASITQPQTAFIFNVLDHFLIDALECKTSAMSFYQKLRRLTNNAFPDKIPDRYWELMRVSRIWRDLTNRIRFGFGHDTVKSPGPGDLALYCPACPQPGINLPSSWKSTYKNWLVMQRYVVDGNFTAQHMNMKNPEEDVSLTDGEGYMVTELPYQAHLKDSKEVKDKSLCSNHRAVNAANIQRSNLRATGVGATACARHGCFVPHSVMDFQKGESHHLSIPDKTKILAAVGQFHLSAHKLLCYPRFGLHFVKGAGHIDGEILETLWAPFNKISPTARSMTMAHRHEVSDDHMQDSNWKKLIGIGKPPSSCYSCNINLKMDKAPTMAEIRLRLTENELSDNGRTGSVAWLIMGINIENAQDALRTSIRQLPMDPTAQQLTVVEETRQKLMTRINKFNEAAEVMTNGIEFEAGKGVPQDDLELCLEEEGDKENMQSLNDLEEEGAVDIEIDTDSPAEVVEVLMPCWAPSDHGFDDTLLRLRQEELELRRGQANDCLEKLHQALGDRSVVFWEKIHSNKAVHHQGKRSKHELHKITLTAMIHLGVDQHTLEVYQPLNTKDLVVNKDITEENRHSQSSDRLAWFWRINNVRDSQKNEWMNEFYQVNWLKAKARYDQWNEELQWSVRALKSTQKGHEAYAEKQAAMWSKFVAEGVVNFEGKMIVTGYLGFQVWDGHPYEWVLATRIGGGVGLGWPAHGCPVWDGHPYEWVCEAGAASPWLPSRGWPPTSLGAWGPTYMGGQPLLANQGSAVPVPCPHLHGWSIPTVQPWGLAIPVPRPHPYGWPAPTGKPWGSHPSPKLPSMWVAIPYWDTMGWLPSLKLPPIWATMGRPPQPHDPTTWVAIPYWETMGRLPWSHTPTNTGGQHLLMGNQGLAIPVPYPHPYGWPAPTGKPWGSHPSPTIPAMWVAIPY